MVIAANLLYLAVAVALGAWLGLRFRRQESFLVSVGGPIVVFLATGIASPYLVEHPTVLTFLIAAGTACLVAALRTTEIAGLSSYARRTNDTASGAHSGTACSQGQMSALDRQESKSPKTGLFSRWRKRQLPSRTTPTGKRIAMVFSSERPAGPKDRRGKGKANHLKRVR